MSQLFSIIYAILASLLTTFVVYNFVPLDYLDIAARQLGSTITTINANDTLRDSRAVINTNFANLNTDKLESGSTASTLTIGTLTLTNDLSIANGGTNASTQATNGVNYFDGTSITSEAAFTYNGSTNLLSADSAAFGTSLVIPQGITVSSNGQITSDNSSGQFRYYAGSEQRVLAGFYTVAFTFASTSQGFGTTTLRLAPAAGNVTFSTMLCDFDKHMGIALYDGTNRSNHIIASSTVGTSTFSTNNTFSMGEPIRVEIGTTTSAVFQVNGACRLFYKYEAD